MTGTIGIFWCHAGKLLALVCRVDEGDVAGGTVDCGHRIASSFNASRICWRDWNHLRHRDVFRGGHFHQLDLTAAQCSFPQATRTQLVSEPSRIG